ncbi:MAG TPA: aldo/keto reductase [Alphaproteobacteria bacterium]
MKTFQCGGQRVPVLGLGTWQLRNSECTSAVEKAIDMGYRHIDTAQIYENEAEVGTGIKNSNIARADIFLTTKVWMDRVSHSMMMKSVDESLRKLKTDYVDLLLIHWPVTNIPFKEQIAALKEVRASGKTKGIGVSNFTVAQMREVHDDLDAPIVTNQVEYHPFLSQQPVLDYIRKNDMFLTAYSPLARGAVTESSVIKEIGMKYNKTPGQVTLRWLVQQDNVVAIPKAASEKHIKSNIDIFDFALSLDDMNRISALAKSDGRLINPEWAPQWDKAQAA